MDIIEEIEEVAMAWFIEFEISRERPPERWQQLDAWLKADPRHAAAYQRAKDEWDALDWMAPALGIAPVRKRPIPS